MVEERSELERVGELILDIACLQPLRRHDPRPSDSSSDSLDRAHSRWCNYMRDCVGVVLFNDAPKPPNDSLELLRDVCGES